MHVCGLFCVLVTAVILVHSPLAQSQSTSMGLANVDFTNIIGGPLTAVIDAQAKAAALTVRVITTMGFNSSGFARTTDFRYVSTNASTGGREDRVLRVPTLTLIPIPFLRISEYSLAFSAKVTSASFDSSSTDSLTSSDEPGSFGSASSKISGSLSTKSSSAVLGTSESEHSFTMRVKAVQDEMPGGLARILSVLEDAILHDDEA